MLLEIQIKAAWHSLVSRSDSYLYVDISARFQLQSEFSSNMKACDRRCVILSPQSTRHARLNYRWCSIGGIGSKGRRNGNGMKNDLKDAKEVTDGGTKVKDALKQNADDVQRLCYPHPTPPHQRTEHAKNSVTIL